jgi:hypothetical protein
MHKGHSHEKELLGLHLPSWLSCYTELVVHVSSSDMAESS